MRVDSAIGRACVPLCAALALAACGDADYAKERETDTGTAEETAPTATGGANEQGDLARETFVAKAASAGLFEVRSADIVLQQEVREPVAQLARRLLEDHRAANEELLTIAGELGIEVPRNPDEQHLEKLRELEELAGEDVSQVETTYLEQQEEGHEQTIELFERATEELPDGQLTSFAEAKLPVLREHLDLVRAQLEGEGGTGQ